MLLLDPAHWFIQRYYAGFSGFEPDVQLVLRRMLKPGGTFIDCGANAGFFSVMANDVMHGTGTVIAVEANPDLLQQLNANLEANGIAHRAIHVAIASHGGVADFFVPARVDEVGGLRPTAVFPDAEVSHLTVPASTLDDLVARLAPERVDMIKIDIEGGEIDALRSARGTIARHRPVLVVEYSCINWAQFGASCRDLEALCDGWRYRICRYDVARDAPVAIEPSFWDSPYANMVLLPEEWQ